MIPEIFRLTNEDKMSSTWRKIHIHLISELQVLREKNDHIASELETARLRGQIGMLKQIIDWNEERKQVIPPRVPRFDGVM